MRRAVIDQPGLKIIVLGLLISIFLGLILRSQITQTKINDHLKKIVHEFQPEIVFHLAAQPLVRERRWSQPVEEQPSHDRPSVFAVHKERDT